MGLQGELASNLATRKAKYSSVQHTVHESAQSMRQQFEGELRSVLSIQKVLKSNPGTNVASKLKRTLKAHIEKATMGINEYNSTVIFYLLQLNSLH